ncbi:MAG TPA: hypothetical protein VIH21_13170 [Dehalococcoidia bacterium]
MTTPFSVADADSEDSASTVPRSNPVVAGSNRAGGCHKLSPRVQFAFKRLRRAATLIRGGEVRMTSSTRSYRAAVAAISLVIGPLLMSSGDLIHPKEKMDAADQAAIIAEHASRWYAAHLLLFIGLLVFIPGILALTRLTAERSPVAGYVSRIFLLAGVGAFSSVFVAEMLIGRYISDGADLPAATALLETFQSGWVLGAVMSGAVAWFAGVAVFATPLVRAGGPVRWPALVLVLGALLILAEIITSQVLLSQIGNLVILAASVVFAWHVVRSEQPAVPS